MGIARLLADVGRAKASAGGKKLIIGHLPAGCVSHLLLAKKRNMFAKAGLNVELIQFNSAADNIQALVSDNLHMMHNPWTTTIAAYAEGTNDLRIVGGSGLSGIELVVRKGSVKNVNEFIQAAGKGLRVGTIRLDTLELVAYGTMSQKGKSYNDYKMTFFPSMVGMGEALIHGAVDTCTLPQPYAESVVKQANGIYLADSNDVWGPEAPDCVVTTKTEFIKKNPKLIKTYLQLLKDSAKVIKIEQCRGCLSCVLACSYHHKKFFSPAYSSISVSRNNQNGIVRWAIDSTCDDCVPQVP